ncbi:MAG TPA: hypothetical protein VEK57_28665 [Thermoanaerobaculia bacterium]|nr:hypothetical protein [Thermoanaerobaculia bacterium]
MRRASIVLFCLTLPLLAAAPKKNAKTQKKKTPPPVVHVSPDQIPHNIALFLRTLSNDGRRTVTFKATAVGTRFFFEENGSVTVYRFENGVYVRERFAKGVKLATAVKRYGEEK